MGICIFISYTFYGKFKSGRRFISPPSRFSPFKIIFVPAGPGDARRQQGRLDDAEGNQGVLHGVGVST